MESSFDSPKRIDTSWGYLSLPDIKSSLLFLAIVLQLSVPFHSDISSIIPQLIIHLNRLIMLSLIPYVYPMGISPVVLPALLTCFGLSIRRCFCFFFLWPKGFYSQSLKFPLKINMSK